MRAQQVLENGVPCLHTTTSNTHITRTCIMFVLLLQLWKQICIQARQDLGNWAFSTVYCLVMYMYIVCVCCTVGAETKLPVPVASQDMENRKCCLHVQVHIHDCHVCVRCD